MILYNQQDYYFVLHSFFMKFCFLSTNKVAFTPSYPRHSPLGGTQSGFAYFAESLAKDTSNEVTLLCSGLREETVDAGVKCKPFTSAISEIPMDFDVLIVDTNPNYVSTIKEYQFTVASKMGENAPPKMPLYFLWVGHDSDQPAVQCLKDKQLVAQIDGFLLVSHYQSKRFIESFDIHPKQVYIVRNGIGRPFEEAALTEWSGEDGQELTDDEYWGKKEKVFVYTTTPFRGLHHLIPIWAAVIKNCPDAKLKVVSGMSLYGQQNSDQIKNIFTALKELKNVTLIEPTGQEELKKHISSALCMLYPCTFPETSCISVLEAMSQHVYILSTQLGALGETTAGFGTLVRPCEDTSTTDYWKTLEYKDITLNRHTDLEFINSFAKRAIDIHRRFGTKELRKELTDASTMVTHDHVWDNLANRFMEYAKRVGPTIMRDRVAEKRMITLTIQPSDREAFCQAAKEVVFSNAKSVRTQYLVKLFNTLSQESRFYPFLQPILEQLAVIHPNNTVIQRSKCVVQVQGSNDPVYVVKQCTEYLKNIGYDEQIALLLAETFDKIKDERSAYETYNSVLRMTPTSMIALNNLAGMEKAYQNHKLADEYYMRSFKQALGRTETDNELNCVISNILLNLQYVSDFVGHDKILDRARQLTGFYRVRADAKNVIKRHDDLRTILEKNKNYPLSYYAFFNDDGELVETADLEFNTDMKDFKEITLDMIDMNKDRAIVNAVARRRKIRLGYITSDMRLHPVGFMLENLLKYSNRAMFDVTVFVNNEDNPFFTHCQQNYAWVHFVSIKNMPDTQALECLLRAHCDIIVDMMGHTRGSRCNLLAYKPAPIQISYFAYPGTNGMDAIQYKIADYHTVPTSAEKNFSETILRMPRGFQCYSPTDIVYSKVRNEASTEKNGRWKLRELYENEDTRSQLNESQTQQAKMTHFGCFNNPHKLNSTTFDVWAEILKNVPDSILHLRYFLYEYSSIREHVYRSFESRGIPRSRLTIKALPLNVALEEYHSIDIALDTFPYNGGTVSIECLYMHTPFIALAGDSYVSRVGVSLLHTVGCPELIASTKDDYVKYAIELSKDKKRLKSYHETMRQKVLDSSIGDGKLFTKDMETLFKDVCKENNIDYGVEKLIDVYG